MLHVYVVVHRDAGVGDFFATREQAEEARRAVIRDEPEWADLVWVERIEYDAADADAPLRAPRRRRRAS
jgi:hypothetical protein